CALHFGLAQALDAKGAYGEAADHLQQANDLRLSEWRKKGEAYDPEEHTRFVDDVLAAFTPALLQRAREFGVESERPIFILGLPRSGTTLIEQILASHSQVFGAGELRLGRDTFQALPRALNRGETPAACLAWLDRATTGRLAQAHLDELSR